MTPTNKSVMEVVYEYRYDTDRGEETVGNKPQRATIPLYGSL